MVKKKKQSNSKGVPDCGDAIGSYWHSPLSCDLPRKNQDVQCDAYMIKDKRVSNTTQARIPPTAKTSAPTPTPTPKGATPPVTAVVVAAGATAEIGELAERVVVSGAAVEVRVARVEESKGVATAAVATYLLLGSV